MGSEEPKKRLEESCSLTTAIGERIIQALQREKWTEDNGSFPSQPATNGCPARRAQGGFFVECFCWVMLRFCRIFGGFWSLMWNDVECQLGSRFCWCPCPLVVFGPGLLTWGPPFVLKCWLVGGWQNMAKRHSDLILLSESLNLFDFDCNFGRKK